MRVSSKITILTILLTAALSGCASQNNAAPSSSVQDAQLQAIMLANPGTPPGGGSSSSASATGGTKGFTTLSQPTIPDFEPRPGRGPDEIAPGNLMHIVCADDKKIDGDFRVEFDGTIKMPYDVKVKAAGLTLTEFKTALQTQYRSFFRSPPQLVVSFSDHKLALRADGLVDKPGEYLISQSGSIDELIAQAGGLQKGQDREAARYARIVDGQYRALLKLSDFYSGSAGKAPVWRGGETVFFQNEGSGIGDMLGMDKRYVQVLGQVRTPGEIAYRDNANFFYYLVQAGGPTDRAAMSRLVLVRSDGAKLQTVKFSVNEPEEIPQIQGGDIVLIQADNPTDFERDTSLFGNIAGFMSSIAAVLVVSGL